MTRYDFLVRLARGLRPMTIAIALTPTLALAGPIHDAVRSGDTATIESLIKSGVYINTPDTDGSTPLIIAALDGKTELVRVLITLGADINGRNDRGMTALHAAAFSGDLDAVKLLRTAGASLVDANNKFGVTPLIVAAEEDRLAVVSYLIGEGVDLDVAERHGYSALTRSGYHGNDDVIAILLKAGAACQVVDPLWLKDCTARKAALGL